MQAKECKKEELHADLMDLLAFTLYCLAESSAVRSKRLPGFVSLSLEVVFSFWPEEWYPNFQQVSAYLLGNKFSPTIVNSVSCYIESQYLAYLRLHSEVVHVSVTRADMRKAIAETHELLASSNLRFLDSFSCSTLKQRIRQHALDGFAEIDRLCGLAS